MTDFTVYARFKNVDEATDLINLLEKHNVQFSLIDNGYDTDITFTGNAISEIQVLVKAADFERVNQLREAEMNAIVDVNDTTHYLHDFTTPELYELITKRDEWSMYDYVLAKKILAKRGETVDEEMLAKLEEKQENTKKEPKKASGFYIFAAYFFALLGGLLGILMGWALWKSEKKLPNGEKTFTYTKSDRENGKMITIIGAVAAVFFIIVRIMIQIEAFG